MTNLQHKCNELFEKRRLIVATNRGPVEYQKDSNGILGAKRASSGITTALNPLANTGNITWISSAMGEGDRLISNQGKNSRMKSPLQNHKIDLRFIVTPRRVYHKYYNVICNPLLWFLQHYMWNPLYNPNVDSNIHDAWTNGYVEVNKSFAKTVIDEAKSELEPPIVISHDYHLYLLPKYIRQELPKSIVQHFIHLPWPTSRYWQMVPKYIIQDILDSLCHSNLLGFQTPQDKQSFLETVNHYLPDAEIDWNSSTVRYKGFTSEAKIYPMTINVSEIERIATSPRALEYEDQFRSTTRETSLIVRVDRAEPNRNIVRGFKAYELLLAQHQELRGKISFLAFLVLSRTHIRQYQRYMDEINEITAKINDSYGTDTWKPIQIFLENNYSQAIAGLKLYDVLLINTIIEGMNLVAKEGPIVNSRDGVLVLSESCGAYHQLKDHVLAVSPTDIHGTMEALFQGITMPPSERRQNAKNLYDSISKADINDWLLSQLEDISNLL